MDIHKPKPVHSWREFFGEVAVVLVGIVIALAGEQLLLTLEWRHKMRQVEEEMTQEISGDAGPQVYERIALSPCINRALDAIRDLVEHDAPRATVLEAIDRFTTPRHTWDDIAWQVALSGGILANIPVQRVDVMSRFYSLMPVLAGTNEREFRDGAALAAVGRFGGPLTDAERGHLLEAVETLRRDDAEMLRFSQLARVSMNQMHISTQDYRPLKDEDSLSQEPLRVVREMEKWPMAQACIGDLKSSLQIGP